MDPESADNESGVQDAPVGGAVRGSFMHDPQSGFTLTSGAKSDVYIDVKKTAMSAEGMQLIGYAMFRNSSLNRLTRSAALRSGRTPSLTPRRS